jgi:glutamyl-tRNA synthetase/glutamyl-Q tRNA(Asp) synthetase
LQPGAGQRRHLDMRTRFAPAPTGYLHLGHVANAIAVWGMARARRAEVLLRIEDHDRQRCRAEYEAALLEDLEWLGLVPDLPPIATFRAGASPYRQSDCGAVYAAAVDRLRERGHAVYACDCSRKTDASPSDGAPVRTYSGRCRERGLAPGPGRGLRVRVAPGEEGFTDLRLGACRQEPATQCGDLLLQDRMGNWTYQFCVVVDDTRQDIDLIVRGEDLLDSTGRQLRLARMLGRAELPAFLHHPLLHKPSGAKLSKADGDTGIRELRRGGMTREALFGRAAWGLGLLPEARPLELDAALALAQGLAK